MRHPSPSLIFVCLTFLFLLATPAKSNEVAVSLRGSPTSMERQNNVATDLGYDFVERPEDIMGLMKEGEIVLVPGNGHYEVLGTVSYPYARPEVRLFIERLAAQYYEGTGEKLVVTSLLRPVTEQPRNSHELSVHPAGIAFDVRISSRRASQQWLESVLLKLERQGLLDVTRERYPPHYHVALFPQAYRAHVGTIIGTEAVELALDYSVEEPKEEQVEREEPTATAPQQATAATVGLIERDTFGGEHLAVLAGLLLAGLIFGLGYWRGVSAGRGKQAPVSASWSNFKVSSTQSPPTDDEGSSIDHTFLVGKPAN